LHTGDQHDHRHRLVSLGRRPFLVGIVHGVAGSAALTLFVLTTIPSVTVGLLYIAVFGLGSVGGMLLMSAMIGLPLAVTARRFTSINTRVRLAAGLCSIALGLLLGSKLIGRLLLN
jgi:high-affinity nickel-transport protein